MMCGLKHPLGDWSALGLYRLRDDPDLESSRVEFDGFHLDSSFCGMRVTKQ